MSGTAIALQIFVKMESVGLLPKYVKYNTFVTFLTVLSFSFLSIRRPGRTLGTILTLYGSNDVFPRKEMSFGGYNDR